MERNFVLSVCVALFSAVTTEHEEFVNGNIEQDVLWTETNVTMIKCMAACSQRNKCFSVQFSLNGTCLGLRGKFVKSSTLRDDSQIEYSYVSDKGKTPEKMKSLEKQKASSRPKTKGKTPEKMKSLEKQKASSRPKTKGKTPEKMKSLEKQKASSRPKTKGKTPEKMKSLEKQKASSRPKTKEKTLDETTSLATRRTSQTHTKNSHKPCVAPPRYPNADLKYITEIGSVKTVKYSCKRGFISCSKTMTRSCLPTGTWETDTVKCVKNTWTDHFDTGQPRFAEDIPCGPQKSLQVTIQGVLLGKRMEILLMGKKDILFYMYYEANWAIFGAMLNGKRKTMLKGNWYIAFNTPFLLKIDLHEGHYLVFIGDYLQNKIKEPKPGAMPSHLMIRWNVNLREVTVTH